MLVPVEEEFLNRVKENVLSGKLKCVTEIPLTETPFGGWILEFTEGRGMIVPGIFKEYLGEALEVIEKAPKNDSNIIRYKYQKEKGDRE